MVFPVEFPSREVLHLLLQGTLCNQPRSNAYVSLKLGNPICQGKCTVRLHTQVWQGLGASGVWETVLCPPRSWAQTSLTAASLGWYMDFVWFLHVEAVALWGFSFMQRSQLQPPSLLSPSADATLVQMQQDLFLYLTPVPLHLPSQGLCHIGLYTLAFLTPLPFCVLGIPLYF